MSRKSASMINSNMKRRGKLEESAPGSKDENSPRKYQIIKNKIKDWRLPKLKQKTGNI